MDLGKVIKEIQKKGEYWRGDSRVWLSNQNVIFEYLPKEGYSPRELIRSKTGGLQFGFDKLLRIKAPQEKIGEVVDLINSIEYPDVHITKRSCCEIKIHDGKVIEIGKPRILYCPIAKERYGRSACTKCHKVVPFLEKEFQDKISEGMFTENRKILEGKPRYTYGASEMLMDALGKVIDACVIVCDGVGTLITNNPMIVQGIGEKMTGVSYTSPHKRLIKKLEETSFVLFPETARISQVEGVRIAKEMGYERIAVTTADNDSINLKAIKEMDVGIVTLALCTSGIKKETAEIIKEHADLTWACGSKYIRNLVGPQAWIQLGTRLPVFVLTEKGFDLTKPRIRREFDTIEAKLILDADKKYHNLKEVDELPVRSEDEPYPLI
jgi:putative methanogenesis marker protein 8